MNRVLLKLDRKKGKKELYFYREYVTEVKVLPEMGVITSGQQSSDLVSLWVV